jgi:hypothetical protein
LPDPAPEPPAEYELPTEPMRDADATKVSAPAERVGEPTIRRVAPPATSAARTRSTSGSERQGSRDSHENDFGLAQDLTRQEPPDRPAG